MSNASRGRTRILVIDPVWPLPPVGLGVVFAPVTAAPQNRLSSAAAVCCTPGNGRSDEEAEVRAAFMFIQMEMTTYLKDMALRANAELGDPGACRRR
ncbi:hypothetical protein [Sphaerisporangium perillae]|uniref:hypothetical protein n=1 Tax=Sphaerisporangium perillae TaxID=2935860 RepID=UPI00200BDB3B|nr:hypothetical protein [Sphaerisporangium perillae]